MAEGFIDMASMNSALSIIKLGRDRTSWIDWDTQSIVKVTHLLMHDNIKIVPSIGQYSGAVDLYQRVVSTFPELEYPKNKETSAEQKTISWLKRYPSALSRAWDDAKNDQNFQKWAEMHRALFLEAHVKSHGSLFNELFIPQIAQVIGCSPQELQRVHSLSSNVNLAKKWSDGEINSEEMELAITGWLIGGMLRGKYHEYFAQEVPLQLLPHPFRKGIEKKLKSGNPEPVTNSAAWFTTMVIVSALQEISPERRTDVWVENIDKARKAIKNGTISLQPAVIESEAQELAATAAKKLNFPTTPDLFKRFIDGSASVGLGMLLGYAVSPWVGEIGVVAGGAVGKIVSPAINQAWKYNRGVSVGEDFTNNAISTTRRFQKLSEEFPGRIKYKLLSPTKSDIDE